ncbi:FecR family protein [Chitinophaga sp.]|uniref:FecR family protein n=1 Tax=Chitinophaga sp. TaxID=1869181 RepID=UPI002F94EBE4
MAPLNRELIQKFLNGKCTAEEEKLVNLFLKDPASEKLLDEMLSANTAEDWQVFEHSQATHPRQEELKASVHKRIEALTVPVRKMRKNWAPIRNAAIWIGLILTGLSVFTISYFGNKKSQLAFVECSNPNGQRSKIILPDSTVVYLGAGSHLKYPGNFAKEKRDIYLYGEAFFEVSKKTQQPFMVHTADVQTMVLGTSFKIEAFKNKPLLVEVATGKVRVDQIGSNFSRPLAVLIPGEKVMFYQGAVKKENVDPEEVKDLKEARLTFNNVSLYDIADALQRWYNVRIRFKKPAKSAERMTLTLDAGVSIDKVLNVLGTAGHFNHELKNGEIIIH